MIDNFELIKNLFYFNEMNNMFFHCQIVLRPKDHKINKVKERVIRSYFIRSKDHLDKVKDEIILLCEHYGARAYINVSGKDFDEVNKHILFTLSNAIYQNNVSSMNPENILNSSAGEVKSRIKRWIIDVDDISIKDNILIWLDSYFKGVNPLNRYNLFLYSEIPTVHGCHLIVRPFDIFIFNEEFPNVDVHKNSKGTLLYYPKSLELQ